MGFVPTSCSIGLTLGSVTGDWPFTLLWLFCQLPVDCKGTSRCILREFLRLWVRNCSSSSGQELWPWVCSGSAMWEPSPAHQRWVPRCFPCVWLWFILCLLDLAVLVAVLTYGERPIKVKRGTFQAVQGSGLLRTDQNWLLLAWFG